MGTDIQRAGIERALTPAWSLRLEYDYLAFGGHAVATPASFFQVVAGNSFGYVPTAGNPANVSQNIQEVKFGLNYRINSDPSATWSAAVATPAAGMAAAASAAFAWIAGWQFEAGARYWMSSGKFQKDLSAGTKTDAAANVLNSRLTYDTTANSGELFARAETPQNLFIKGFIGGGNLTGGHMNDEDWLIFDETVPYSNTVSDPVKGTLAYATVDFGYDGFRGPGYKLGPFVGYNYYRDDKNAYGCVQIANPLSDCVPSIPSSTLGITENDTWNSLRVGVNGEMMVLPGVKLSADVAYLPVAQFKGQSIHWQRADVADQLSPQAAPAAVSRLTRWCLTPSRRRSASASAAATGRCGRTTTPSRTSSVRLVRVKPSRSKPSGTACWCRPTTSSTCRPRLAADSAAFPGQVSAGGCRLEPLHNGFPL